MTFNGDIDEATLNNQISDTVERAFKAIRK
jgi:hypothetical protein